MQLQLFDSDKNLVILQPSAAEETAQLQAVVATVAAQYGELDEVILNVPELDVSITQAALDDALATRANPQAPFALSLPHFYNIFRMLGSVGQEYPILVFDPAATLTRDTVGYLGDCFFAISRQIPERAAGGDA
ncbi:MAG: hypothetical protein H3C49_01765 [Alphaproteobacteria bacterium]|nr:hypothetical protein [Alphaproteobacteria bacterium]